MTYLYLAGDIALATATEAETWREEVKNRLRWSRPHVKCLNPLRGEERPINDTKYGYHSGGTYGEIFSKNWFDVKRSDLVLAVMFTKDCPSIGTLSEINWAWCNQKPVILVTQDPRIDRHPLIKHMVPTIYGDLDSALNYIEMLTAE